jgi:hypothetical protein
MTPDELKKIRARIERDAADIDAAPTPHDPVESCIRNTHAQVDRAELLGEVERLRALLARLAAEEHETKHVHWLAGTWDASNGPPYGGKPCARCHAFADAREALGQPRWPLTSPAWPHAYQPPRPATITCGPRCGCGGHP